MKTFMKTLISTAVVSCALGISATAVQAANVDQALVEKGHYVAIAGDCVACHTKKEGGKPFAGGRRIDSPFGPMYSTNITPDKATGIGNYTYEQFAAAVREGVRADGAHLYPAMPYPSYAGITDSDMKALYAYFMHGVEPVNQQSPETDLSFPFNQRWGVGLWNWVFGDNLNYQQTETEDSVARGKYLVETLAHCGSCHTPRGFGFQEKAMTGDDEDYLAGGDIVGWHAPNIRAGKGGGISEWNKADIVAYLQTGRNSTSSSVGEMSPVVEHSMSKLDEADVNAIASYLKTLPGDLPAPQHDQTKIDKTVAELTSADQSAGARLYMDNCSACHFASGKGASEVFPKLDGNALVNTEDPEGLIHVILAGDRLPSTAKRPETLAMPGFGWRLNDEEAAQLLTFIRSAWHNNADAVDADDVADVRAKIPAEVLNASAPDIR